MKRKLVIFGAGVMAKLAHYYFSRDSSYEVSAFVVNQAFLKDPLFLGLPIHPFESIESHCSPRDFDLFVALGPSQMNRQREEIFHAAQSKGYALASYVSPTALCQSPVGKNCFIGDRAHIHPFATVGDDVFAWDHALIAHDSIVGNHCYLAPKSVVSTFSKIGDNCIIGTAAVINTRVAVAPKSLIGATCFVSQDTQESGVYGEKSSKFYGALSHKVNIS